MIRQCNLSTRVDILFQLDMNVPYHSGSNPQVRKFVVSGILESEKNYVDILDILLQVSNPV